MTHSTCHVVRRAVSIHPFPFCVIKRYVLIGSIGHRQVITVEHNSSEGSTLEGVRAR